MSIIYKNGTYYGGGGAGAEITIDNELSSTSENPIQNKVIKTELDNKVDKVAGKGLSTNDYTDEEKNKLAGITAGAEPNVQPDWNQTNTSADDFIKNKPAAVIVDSALDGTSENPVQNKVIHSALSDKADTSTIGDLTDLTTDVKTDLVSAINEVAGGSSGGATYTAGDGIKIEDDEISVDEMPSADLSEFTLPAGVSAGKIAKYSLEEQIVGEWIDGKPLYQKTFVIDGLSDEEAITLLNYVELDYDNTDYIYLYSAVVSDINGYYISPFCYSYEDAFGETKTSYVQFELNNKTLDLHIKDRSPVRAIVTIQYTKSTDTATISI